MIEKIDKVITASFKAVKAMLVLLLCSMIALLVAHIFCRYILNQSLTWSEELLRILLVWFGMLSVSVLAVRREHVAIVVFKNMMPAKLNAFFTKLTQFLTVLICLLVTVVGFQYILTAGHRLTPALRLPYGWAYAAIPVSFLVVTLYELRNFIADLTGTEHYAAVEKPEEDLTGGKEVKL